jgi:hypothetical protein
MRMTITGEEQYARFFDAMASEVTDLREPLSRVSKRLTETVGQNFLTEGAHGGGRWQSNSTAYQQWKDQAYPGRPLLVLHGDMRAAFLAHGQRELTATRLVWGIDDQTDSEGNRIADRALAHQAGEGHMPQRKIVSIRADDRRFFDHEFVAHINYLRRSLMGGRL